MADVELQVPKQPDEGRDVVLNGTAFLREDEQVDIRMRVQLAASVAADGEQREVVVAFEPVLPDLRQERVDEPCPFRHQPVDVRPGPELLGQRPVGLRDASPQLRGIQTRVGSDRGGRRFETLGMIGLHAVRAD